MTTDLTPPTVIEDQDGLEDLLDVLEDEDVIAVDTEADSFFSYREKVCLIQITAGDHDYLIDPLADIDLADLGQFFADESKVKIFHDGEYDVLIMGRDYGFRFKNIFDTRLAASALGSQSPGLASVLEEHFDIVLDKSMQRSNWGERPLSERQIDYARLDTHYLHELRLIQRDELNRLGRHMILDGECRRLEALDTPAAVFNPDEWVRLKGARALSPNSRQALRELFILRDELAHKSDVPPFRIMNNNAIVEAAIARPDSTQGIVDVHGFSWRQVRRIGEQILDALDRAEDLGPLDDLPRLPPKDGTGGLDQIQMELFERLKSWRRDRSKDEQFDASLILNRHVLLRLVRSAPSSMDELKAIEGLLEWQIDRYGDSLLSALEKFADDVAAGLIVPGRRKNGPRKRG
ncbi:MAG: ribonuclease D [Planctomycetota bacterium]|jgi:ribonuclease D